MMQNTIEILAPAGGREALNAAVFSGADAVYLGGSAFGARASAKNFTNEELGEAVAFCRARGVRVHVTVNTLLKDGELSQVLNFVRFLCSIPVDAVLVQDMGLFSLLRERAPELPLHASTQMSLHTPGGVKLLYELGAERAVLARELALGEIREISDSCPIEIESFVHGALCMSVSGQCYFSAMLGGRSGNRGMCAQPCRLPFAAPGGTGNDLSLKDLSFIREVEELKQAGVCSAKIEGRMKRPEYVAAAVSACRKAADGEAVPEELTQNLEAVFSRSGFTKGYLTGKRGADMFGIRTREDVAGATEKVFSALRGLYRGERPSVPVSLRLAEKAGGLCLTVRDGDGHEAQVQLPPEVPGGVVLPQERCVQQLAKTGGTPFLANEILVPEEGVPTAVSALNALRREALQKLLELREKKEAIPYFEKPLAFFNRKPRSRESLLPLRAYFHSAEQVCGEAKACESIAVPLGTVVATLRKLRGEGYPPVLLELPRAMYGKEARVRDLMVERMEAGFRGFVCGNLGSVWLARELGAQVHGGFSLNVANTAALEFFQGLGLSSAELSFELTGKEIGRLGGRLPRGVMVYGRQALMLVRNCPLANSKKGCLNCEKPGYLTDRKKVRFPVLCQREGGVQSTEIFNSVPLWLGDRENELKNADFGILRFTVENSVECGRLLAGCFRQEQPKLDYTRGLFYRGVE